MGDEEAEPMRCERERERERDRESECVRERRVRWKYVGVEILTWRFLEEDKKFLLTSSFTLN